MSNRQKSFAALIFAWLTALALTPLPGQTIEEVCADRDGRTDDAWVRVAWTAVETAYDGVRVTYCVLRGHRAARLAFERDAEIVYFALARLDRRPERRPPRIST
ncbi:MAG: hypothetical protein ACT443_14155 [Gemmatimonadota bacterium]